MILNLPILDCSPPNTGTPPRLFINKDRFNLVFSVNDNCIYYAIMPNTWQGNSLNVKIYWAFVSAPAGTQSATWGVSFQELYAGFDLNDFNFGTQRTASGSSNVINGLVVTTVNLLAADVAGLTGNEMFRLNIKLTALTGPSPYIQDLVLDNGP